MSRTIRRVDESKGVSNRSLKATKQYFPVVLFIMLYKVVLTFESVDETRGAVYYTVQSGSSFSVYG